MLLKTLRLLIRLPLLLLHLLLALPITLLCSAPPLPRIRLFGRSLDVVMESWWTATACRLFGLRIVVSGEVQDTPSLVVANHISWLDIPLLYSVAPMGFVSKAEVDRWPVLGFIARRGHTLFHSRGSHDSARSVLAEMVERLQQGKRVTIFPEGGILPGEHIKPFHARLFAAAAASCAPVQPMMLRYVKDGRHYQDIRFRPGENFLMNFFRLLTQPPRLAEVAILQPIAVAGLQRKDLASAAQAAVLEAYNEGLLP
jgi:1-acyl-sn-glycerol-3-phosphate acyltransferase